MRIDVAFHICFILLNDQYSEELTSRGKETLKYMCEIKLQHYEFIQRLVGNNFFLVTFREENKEAKWLR